MHWFTSSLLGRCRSKMALRDLFFCGSHGFNQAACYNKNCRTNNYGGGTDSQKFGPYGFCVCLLLGLHFCKVLPGGKPPKIKPRLQNQKDSQMQLGVHKWLKAASKCAAPGIHHESWHHMWPNIQHEFLWERWIRDHCWCSLPVFFSFSQFSNTATWILPRCWHQHFSHKSSRPSFVLTWNYIYRMGQKRVTMVSKRFIHMNFQCTCTVHVHANVQHIGRHGVGWSRFQTQCSPTIFQAFWFHWRKLDAV